MLALISQANQDLRVAGIKLSDTELVEAVAEELAGMQMALPVLECATRAITNYVDHLLDDIEATNLDIIRSYTPSLSQITAYSENAGREALRQARVSRSRLASTENPVGVAVRTLEDLAVAREAWSMVDQGDWWDAYQEAGSDGPFKTWVERHTEELGKELAEQLAWGLILLESQRHLGLVWTIIHRMADNFPDHSAQDMFGWGWYGLTQAIRSYDPGTAAFSTYAARRINGAIRDGIRSEHHLPKRLTSVVREISVAEEDLVADLGRSPSLEELASHVGATLAELELARTRYQVPASIEELMGSGEDEEERAGPSWVPSANDDPAIEAVSTLQADAVAAAVLALPPEEREAIRLLIFEGMSTAEAAEITGLSTRQLRRARDRGLEAMAEDLKEWAS